LETNPVSHARIGLLIAITLVICIAGGMVIHSQTQAGPAWITAGCPTGGANITVTGTWPSCTIAGAQSALMTGTTASMGGSLLVLGGCNTTTVTVSGATTSMVAVTSPVTTLANGIQWQAAVTSANTVTVYECALLSITPASTPFNVRVIP
jgi:hypothetical protein